MMKGDHLSWTDGQGHINRWKASSHYTASHHHLILIALLLAACSLDVALAIVEGATPAYDIPLPGNMTGTAQSGTKIIQDNPTGSDRATAIYPCKQTTDALSILTKNLTFPDHLASKDAVKAGGEFDINSYFTVLDHLSMQPGYILDYVYFFEGIGGEPVIYARKADQPAYQRYSDFASGRNVESPFEESKDYLEHVVADGTPESYFQYALLYLMGGQFYLYWHANYNDQKAVCDISEARAIIERLMGQGSQPIYPQLLNSFSQKDFGPRVVFRGDEAEVQLVVFTEWGGFIQKSIAIRREFPHSILNETSKTIIPYDCGINF